MEECAVCGKIIRNTGEFIDEFDNDIEYCSKACMTEAQAEYETEPQETEQDHG